ncbi:hypothetical protein KSS87_000074 [Heliosperma pusillum]|nr:hypothetical protein KSS87_000074 [Heliosperma pusillum]
MAAVAKDPAIKLFGTTISLHEPPLSEDSESLENESSMMTKAGTEDCRNENSGTMEEIVSLEPCKVEQPQTSMQQSTNSQAISDSKAHHEESDDSEEPNSSKRPDKIIPCPRCNSLDTKFCYFNNYNVNQPRHFCKSCQRYWTAGGTVRNVPVGAGRRRNKHLASQYQQIVGSSDGGSTAVVEPSAARNHLLSCEESASSCTGSSPNEMVLKFGPESPHCDSGPNLVTQSQIKGYSDMNPHNCGPSQQPFYQCPSNSSSCRPYLVPGCTAQSTPNISVQFVPASYWNYIPVWVAGPGNVPVAVRSGNGLQVLGKHSRETVEGEISAEGISSSKMLKIQDIDQP